MSGKVYLAGPINHFSYAEAMGWRDEAMNLLTAKGLVVASPMRGKEMLKGTIIEGSYDEFPLSSQRGITARDRYDTQSADVVLACFLGAEIASCGTPIEFGWADAARIPVVMVMEPEGNPFDHPMMREIAAFRVETVEEACLIVDAIINVR